MSVTLDLEKCIGVLNQYVRNGLMKEVLRPESINLEYYASEEPKNIEEAIKAYVPLFDALVIFSTDLVLGKRPWKRLDQKPLNAVSDINQIERALGVIYFHLLIRGAYPKDTDRIADMPFLKTYLNATQDYKFYRSILSSFNIELVSPVWIKAIDISKLDPGVVNRISLGIAGHRQLQIFGIMDPKSDLELNYLRIFKIVREWSKFGLCWDIHPITRGVTTSKMLGSLNKNLNNLITKCYSATQIEEMVTQKMLTAKPTFDPRHQQWSTWTDAIQFCDPIFGSMNE